MKVTGTSSSYYRGAVYGYASRTAQYPSYVYGTGTPTPDGTYSLMVSYTLYTQACKEYNASGWSTQRCTGRY